MDILQEIKQIIQDEIAKAIKGIELPEKFDLDLINNSDIKVEIPKLDFSGLEQALLKFAESKRDTTAPVDMRQVEALLGDIVDNLSPPDMTQLLEAVQGNKPLPAEPVVVDFGSITAEFNQGFKDVTDRLEKQNTSYKGGAMGPSKINLKNAKGAVINPATSEDTVKAINKDGETVKIGATGADDDELKVQDPYTYTLEEILRCQKKIIRHLELMTNVKFEDYNVDQ